MKWNIGDGWGTWELTAEEVEKFGGEGRCVVAVYGDKLLAVLRAENYHSDAALRAAVARMRGGFARAVWCEGIMAGRQFWVNERESAQWFEKASQHDGLGREEPRRAHDGLDREREQ